MSDRHGTRTPPTLGDRQLLFVGVGWTALLVGLGLYVGSVVVPPALAACLELCESSPFLLGLMQCLPLVGRAIIVTAGALAAGAVTFDLTRRLRRTSAMLGELHAIARPVPRRLRTVADDLGLTEAIVYIADQRPLAFCCGALRPSIVVSTGLIGLLSAGELRAVLRHESHHLRRRDPLRLAVVRTLARVLFYLPVALDVRHRSEVAAELAADDEVLTTEPVQALAGALLKSARAGRLQAGMLAVGAFDATGARIARLTGRGSGLPGLSYRRLAISLLVSAGLLLGAVTAAYAAGPGAAAGCCTQSTVCPTHN
ncbi:MAG: M56 family metallopeptidase [Chloroflexota bacterium]